MNQERAAIISTSVAIMLCLKLGPQDDDRVWVNLAVADSMQWAQAEAEQRRRN